MSSTINVLIDDTTEYVDEEKSTDDTWEPVRANPDSDNGYDRGLGGRIAQFSESSLQATLTPMVNSLSTIFTSLDQVNGMKLRTINVGLEISAEGGFVLIGSGKLGSKGAVTLTFELP